MNQNFKSLYYHFLMLYNSYSVKTNIVLSINTIYKEEITKRIILMMNIRNVFNKIVEYYV